MDGLPSPEKKQILEMLRNRSSQARQLNEDIKFPKEIEIESDQEDSPEEPVKFKVDLNNSHMKTIDEENSVDLVLTNPHSKRSSGQYTKQLTKFAKENSGRN